MGFFDRLINGSPEWQKEQKYKKEKRELDKRYPSSKFHEGRDDEDGYDWGAHNESEYNGKADELGDKYYGSRCRVCGTRGHCNCEEPDYD